MTNWRTLLLVVGLLLTMRNAPAQTCCTFHDWWSGQSTLLDQHPVAHVLGGVGLDLVSRGPWFKHSWRKHAWERLAFVAVGQGVWEYIQWENWKQPNGVHSYPAKYGLWDLGTAFLSAGLFEIALHKLKV